VRTDAKTLTERAIAVAVLVVALLAPTIFSAYWLDAILTQTLIFGLGAASLILLSAYGGMISLAQTALMGVAGYALGNMVSQGGAGGESKGLLLGWDPTVSLVLAIVVTTLIAFVFGAVASRSYGIYFLMLTLTFGVVANLFVGSVTKLGGFSPIAGIDRRVPGFAGDVVNDRQRLYYMALVCAVVAYFLIKYLVRTPFGLSLQGIRDEPIRASSLGFTVPLHRMLAFTLAGFLAAVAGVLAAWWNGQISPDTLGLNATISLLVMAVIGGLGRIEGAWLGALAFIVISNEASNRIPADGLPVIGGTFNTVIGFVFLAIVLVSPDGLMGIWERAWAISRRKGGPPAVEVALSEPAAGASS
jgi:branched-chain amino acid transport system permease protein